MKASYAIVVWCKRSRGVLTGQEQLHHNLYHVVTPCWSVNLFPGIQTALHSSHSYHYLNIQNTFRQLQNTHYAYYCAAATDLVVYILHMQW